MNGKAAKSFLAVLAALMVVLMAVSPAIARGAGDKGKGQETSEAAKDKGPKDKGPSKGDRDGDADSDASTAYTEDTDTNDGGTPNNQVDEGDNKHPSGNDKSEEKGNSGNQGKSESDPDDDGRGPDRSNGGPDKPNGSGGVDKADQDGNNGCGNDDDFEDDNEGWCGSKPDKDLPERDEVAAEKDEKCVGEMGGSKKSCDEAEDEVEAVCTVDAAMTEETCDDTEDAVDGAEVCAAEGTMTDGSDACTEMVAGADVDAVNEVEGEGLGDKVLGEFVEQTGGNSPDQGEEVLAAGASAEDGSALPFTGGDATVMVIIALALLVTGGMLLKTRRL